MKSNPNNFINDLIKEKERKIKNTRRNVYNDLQIKIPKNYQ